MKTFLAHPRAPLAIVAGLTVLFLAVGLWNLGAGTFPSSGWKGDGEAVLDLGSVQQVERVFFAVWDPEPLKVEVSCAVAGGEGAKPPLPQRQWAYQATASVQGDYKQWASATTRCDTRHIRLVFNDSRATVTEIVPVRGRDAVRVVNVEGPPGAEKLADEGFRATGTPTYLHGAYFDEIYFMRTADEYLRRAPPFFEWTHPALGKDLIALSILVAGNGPLGWRLLGVLAGAAAIPAAFLLGRNLLGNRRAGIVVAALVTFDFMHFTQARIATGEIFLFLFLTGMWAFFAKWWTAPREKLIQKNIWKDPLFLAAVFFGLALSVKVVAVNSLLALLLLALLRLRKERDLFRASVRPFVSGLAVAGAIYLAAYAPYYASGLGIGDVLGEQCCGPRSILAYHATLEAPHPYGSPWWSWPLMLHPLWVYGETFGNQVSTIVSMGNPVLWWAGLAFVALALFRAKAPSGSFRDVSLIEKGNQKSISARWFGLALKIQSRVDYFLVRWRNYTSAQKILSFAVFLILSMGGVAILIWLNSPRFLDWVWLGVVAYVTMYRPPTRKARATQQQKPIKYKARSQLPVEFLEQRSMRVKASEQTDSAALFIGAVWLVQWLAFVPIGRVLFLYHYFPNVALLALGCAWGVERVWAKDPRRGLGLAVALVASAAALFAVFYPVISGAPVDTAYKDALRWVRFGFPLWWGKNQGQPASWDF